MEKLATENDMKDFHKLYSENKITCTSMFAVYNFFINICVKNQFQIFLLSRHKRAGKDSPVRLLIDDCIELIYKQFLKLKLCKLNDYYFDAVLSVDRYTRQYRMRCDITPSLPTSSLIPKYIYIDKGVHSKTGKLKDIKLIDSNGGEIERINKQNLYTKYIVHKKNPMYKIELSYYMNFTPNQHIRPTYIIAIISNTTNSTTGTILYGVVIIQGVITLTTPSCTIKCSLDRGGIKIPIELYKQIYLSLLNHIYITDKDVNLIVSKLEEYYDDTSPHCQTTLASKRIID